MDQSAFASLSTASTFNAYPMPWLYGLLHQVRQARYLSTLDLSRDIFRFPCMVQTRRNSFSKPLQTVFIKMPFGLHGTAATFQHLMDRVLQPVAGFAVAYIDDTTVFSNSWEAHLCHL